MRDRLFEAIAAAGLPCDGYTAEGSGGTLLFPAGTSQAQRDAAAELLAGFDWSAEAQAAWEEARARAAAAAYIASRESLPRAVRASDYALMGSLQEARVKINELVAWANAAGATIAPLVTGDTVADAQQTVKALIDMGV